VSAEQTEQLHHDAIVVDTMGPPGPSLHTQKMLDRLDELVADAVPPALAIDEMELMADVALLAGELDGFWDGWKRSGVDVSSVTIGAFGAQPFTSENAVRDIERWHRKFDELDRFAHVRAAADAEKAHESGRRGIILNFQNTEHFGNDLSVLGEFYERGVRIIQLTYNGHNLVGDGCTQADPKGLSSFGVEVVKRMNDLGILVDVSHCSEPTSLDAVEASAKPIAITHGFSKALNPHDRGASDDLLRAVGENGGYVGIVLVPFFLTTEPKVTLDHFVRHVDHVASLIGIDHVGVGTDWAPPVPTQLQALLTEEVRRIGFRAEHRVDWGATIEELPNWTDWPNITRALVDHGLSDDEVRGVLGGNFLRVFREVAG
jgi:membrane dipeptidase